MRRLSIPLLAALAALALPATALADGSVYTSTNGAGGNAVQVFRAGDHGRLHTGQLIGTGGLGTGAGLGSQGSVTLASGGHWLFVVNAGSNSVTLFRVDGGRLQRRDVVSSHGITPISVTQSGRLVYVVNSGSASIAGFRREHGRLRFLSGSVRPLSAAGAGPAEIAFRPGGGALVVTEKATSLIDSFRVRADGRTAAAVTHPSSGTTPFGFAFAGAGTLVVSEAFGGAPGASATSSYQVGRHGGLSGVTASLANGQSAACWVSTTADGRLAFVSNTGSNTVSSYAVAGSGALQLLGAAAGATGAAPADSALGQSDRFLYVLAGGDNAINAFRVGANGSLHSLGTASGFASTTAGLAASR